MRSGDDDGIWSGSGGGSGSEAATTVGSAFVGSVGLGRWWREGGGVASHGHIERTLAPFGERQDVTIEQLGDLLLEHLVSGVRCPVCGGWV